MKPADFIQRLVPLALKARLAGSPLFVSVRLAQNLLETGGKLNAHNNLGGFKATGKPNEWWTGQTYTTPTWEVVGGKRVNTVATWRSYGSVYDFYRDQDRLFGNARYKRVRESKNPAQQAAMLEACGYATDPQYAEKLKRIMDQYNLYQYDKEAEELNKDDASKVIRYLQAAWSRAQDKKEKDEIHRLANVVRESAGISTN